jgi:hypothetical protein
MRIGCSVRQSYPDETTYVNQREKEIMDMWKALQDRAKQRRKQLADAEEEQMFKQTAKDLVRSALTEKKSSTDSIDCREVFSVTLKIA